MLEVLLPLQSVLSPRTMPRRSRLQQQLVPPQALPAVLGVQLGNFALYCEDWRLHVHAARCRLEERRMR